MVIFKRSNLYISDELFEMGKSKNGRYLVQPAKHLEPFFVYCEFDLINGTGVTVFSHDVLGQEVSSIPGGYNGCQNPGSQHFCSTFP